MLGPETRPLVASGRRTGQPRPSPRASLSIPKSTPGLVSAPLGFWKTLLAHVNLKAGPGQPQVLTFSHPMGMVPSAVRTQD